MGAKRKMGGDEGDSGGKEKEDAIQQERRRLDIVGGGGYREMGCKEKEDVIQKKSRHIYYLEGKCTA